MSQSQPRKYFGTDGIRGRAPKKITPALAMRVGQAAGLCFMQHNGHRRHQVVVGKDPRISGYMIEYAMVAGFTSVGVDVLLVGPLPTPAVATMTKSMLCDLGVVISASHNSFEDNGIKFFGKDGYKLPDDVELEIEALIDSDLDARLAESEHLGMADRIETAQGRYIEAVKRSLPQDVSFEGLNVVLDCANGAAYKVAPQALRELGAKVIAMGVDPDGKNINREVGSTDPRMAAARVLETKADVGIALDGDADRLIMIDEKGQVIDGDQILASIASFWKQENRLVGGVIATIMSNTGLERFVKRLGFGFGRTPVGDRYVIEMMRKRGYNLGGEQSGHVICSDYSTTGDGLLASLQVLAYLMKMGRPASEVLHAFTKVPQIDRKVKDPQKLLLKKKSVQRAIAKAEKAVGKKGRILVRNSGTEPIVRLMVECDNLQFGEKVMDDLLASMKQ